MDHIRKIQTIVDESRERLPTGVATDIMQECQNAFKDKSELCRVCVTWFHTSTHVTPGEGYDDDKVNTKTIHHTQNLLLEAIDARPPDLHYCADLINQRKSLEVLDRSAEADHLRHGEQHRAQLGAGLHRALDRATRPASWRGEEARAGAGIGTPKLGYCVRKCAGKE